MERNGASCTQQQHQEDVELNLRRRLCHADDGCLGGDIGDHGRRASRLLGGGVL